MAESAISFSPRRHDLEDTSKVRSAAVKILEALPAALRVIALILARSSSKENGLIR